MKKLVLWTGFWLIVLCAVLSIFTGCAALDKAAALVSRPGSTNYVTVTNTVVERSVEARTNFVSVPDVQIVQGAPVTNYVQVPQLVFITNAVPVTRVEMVTNIVYVAREGIETGLGAAKVGAAFVPPPYGEVATVGLGLLSAGLGALVRRRNGEVVSAQTQLRATVLGVEKVAKALPAGTGDQIKETIAQVSKALGVADDLHASVQEITAPASHEV